MKGFLRACLLLAIQCATMAHAYDADIHYSTTWALARAIGWTPADALTIASADQGVDENQDTVAALEMDASSGLGLAGYVASALHQSERNLKLHCFSRTRGQAGQIAADVRRVMSGRFSRVPALDGDPRNDTTSLIALGTALHCQQDAHAHAGFGGSCGSHSGSCLGHTYQTFLDQVGFGLFGKHLYNPDHPGVSGAGLLRALQGTANELAARGPKTSVRAIAVPALAALAERLRASGLELPDETRRDCNRYVAGQWLHDYLGSVGRAPDGEDRLERLPPEVAATCGDEALRSAIVVRIPAARFPRLTVDASPALVRADGTYELVRGVDADASLPRQRR